jgi:hypothetical protein
MKRNTRPKECPRHGRDLTSPGPLEKPNIAAICTHRVHIRRCTLLGGSLALSVHRATISDPKSGQPAPAQTRRPSVPNHLQAASIMRSGKRTEEIISAPRT